MSKRHVPGWRISLGVLLGASAFFFLLHPAPPVLWFDFSWITYKLLPLGLGDAIQWHETAYKSAAVRPVRAIQWWLAVKGVGCCALGYYIINVLMLGVVVFTVTWLAWEATGSRACGLLVGACLAVTYSNVFFILFFGYSLGTACAFAGLAAYFRSENLDASRRRPFQLLALLLLALGSLSHETFLAFALVPVAYSAVVRRDGAAVRRALIPSATLLIYALARQLESWAYGAKPSFLGSKLTVARTIPGLLIENPGRVLFEILTGGLPLDPLRALPYIPEFVRLRELLLMPVGLVTVAIAVAPGIGLIALGVSTAKNTASTRRFPSFLLLWLAMGTLPLMLPITVAEAVHVVAALPALFLLWSQVLVARRDQRRAVLVVGWTLLVLWGGMHGTARWVLFHRDVPAMGRSVEALHQVLAAAHIEGTRAHVLFFPVHIGGHYGMLPAVPPLYPGKSASGRSCLRGHRVEGCLVEPIWVWSTLRPWVSLPRACRDAHGIRVGPMSPAISHLFEGSHRMLGHWATSIVEQKDPQLLGVCPISSVERTFVGGVPYLLYRVDMSPEIRWYQFRLEPGPALLPIDSCAAAAPEGAGNAVRHEPEPVTGLREMLAGLRTLGA